MNLIYQYKQGKPAKLPTQVSHLLMQGSQAVFVWFCTAVCLLTRSLTLPLLPFPFPPVQSAAGIFGAVFPMVPTPAFADHKDVLRGGMIAGASGGDEAGDGNVVILSQQESYLALKHCDLGFCFLTHKQSVCHGNSLSFPF